MRFPEYYMTEGKFGVDSIAAENGDADTLFRIAAAAESLSSHPAAKATVSEYRTKTGKEPGHAGDLTEIAGMGIKCTFEGAEVLCGNERLMASAGFAVTGDSDKTCIHVAYGGGYLGYISLSDRPKSGAKDAIGALKREGAKTYMLSGDRKSVAEEICGSVGIDHVVAELLPDGKVEELKKIAASSDGKCVFTGDGINDAPSIAVADVGIAMGALGSDIAIECADIVLLDDDPMKVAQAYTLSKRVRRTVIQNIVFALAVKAAVLVLGALGFAPMWAAVIADVGVSVIAILNSMRLLRASRKSFGD